MISQEEFPQQHLVIATPCYGGSVFQNYYMSVLKFVIEAYKVNLPISFIIRGGDSLIPRIRNSMVAEFMATSGYTHLLWIDADIGFDPDQVMRLLMADRDVACAIYPLKKINWPEDGIPAGLTQSEFTARYTKYPFNPISNQARVDDQGFMEVLDAPTGMMMIKRGVFDQLIKAYPGLHYVADEMLGLEHLRDKIKQYHYRFFDVMTEESGRYLSEDYAFCRRWQNIGGRIYADVRSNLTHQGGHLFTGNLMDTLKFVDAQARQEAEQVLANSVGETKPKM